jgi:hypothetical protein
MVVPQQSSHVMVIAAFCAVLTWVGFFLSPPDPVWSAVANRLFTVTVIGITGMLSLVRKRAEDDLKVLHGLLPICSYCKKIRDIHGYWEQIERYIAARSEADFSHGMCPDCGEKDFPNVFSHTSGQAPPGLSHMSNYDQIPLPPRLISCCYQ